MRPPKDATVYENFSSTFWFDKDGILYSISKRVRPQSLEEAKRELQKFINLTSGKKVCMLADVTNSSESTKEVRDFVAIELPKLIRAIAMVSDSALGKMLANLFFSLKTQPYPVKMFNDEKEARKWLDLV